MQKPGIVLTCSSASDVGELADKLARKLSSNNVYTMKCLAKIAAHDKELIDSLQDGETLVIDGCPEDCGRKIMEEAWLSNYQYIRLSDLNCEKGKTLVTEELVHSIYEQIICQHNKTIVSPVSPLEFFSNSAAKCDIFVFMSKYVGLKVLHPGGMVATKRLMKLLELDKSKRVIDIGCGRGSTSIAIAKKYGCKVVGVDMSEDLINEARLAVKKEGVGHLVEFIISDAAHLPFHDNEFDIAITQAVLVLVNDQQKVINEAQRVLKAGGKSGWIELTWKSQPADEFKKEINDVICAYCMSNVVDVQGWLERFDSAGCNKVNYEMYDMKFSGIKKWIKDEGLFNAVRIMIRCIFSPTMRDRFGTMTRFFNKNKDIVGYGIYTVTK